MVGHYRKDQLYFMDIGYFEKAVKSLEEFPGMVGIIGGEPTLHPEFKEFCSLLKEYIPEKERRGLWTYRETHEEHVLDTFGFFSINNKRRQVYHTPILASSVEVVKDEKQRNLYIDNCWVQNYWSATINPKGGWFCEVAGAFSVLMDGPGGRDIGDPNWWKQSLESFKDQREWACSKCGAAIPLKPRLDIKNIDDITPDNFEILKDQSDKIKRGRYQIFDGDIDNSQKRSSSWHYNYERRI
jgi:hypothetical protein